MKSSPFLWEIGCEEIPASWLSPLVGELRERFVTALDRADLQGAKVRSFGTLRRLVLHAPRLPEKQEDRTERVIGPPLQIARDESGNWTRAALGFAKKNDVGPEALAVIETAKGDYVGIERHIKGEKTLSLLPGLMAQTLRALSFPKFMNWDASLDDGKGAFPFGRPIRWMVALFGKRVVPFEIRVVGSPPVLSGRKTVGHRFLAPRGERPGKFFSVSSFRELEGGLSKHYVILDPQKRRTRLERELKKLEKKAGSKKAPGLSAELVAQLVEWPGAVLGSYPTDFLVLPEEVRHTVLIHHQHYFPLKKKPAFIAVTNMASDRKGYMRRGAERVVVARLRDAKFFWDDDLKRPLEDRKRELEGVLFHDRLGSYRQKSERIAPLASAIAEACGGRGAAVGRAAELAKCDLVTGMVGEFPELQGLMGGLYAREQGEPEAVWKAIYSHYQPASLAEDESFPLNREGAIVALADKIDTVASLFAAGVVPTGSRDPFGLRRSALGAIRILLESGARLDFPMRMPSRTLLEKALGIVREKGTSVEPRAEESLKEFFSERLRFVLSRRFRYDEVNAVFALGALERPVEELEERLEAVAALRGSPDFEALSVAFKRVDNILSGRTPGAVDPGALVETEEKALLTDVERLEPQVTELVGARRYADALMKLSTLRPRIDQFFDTVLVMAEDERLRENRLALLDRLRGLFSRVADLSQIVAGEERR